jgi:hypothetical protein
MRNGSSSVSNAAGTTGPGTRPTRWRRCAVSEPGLPNELDVDPEVALGPGGEGAEPLPEPIVDPEHPDHVEPAPHAVPAPEDAGR